MSEVLEGEIVNHSKGVRLTKHPEDVVTLLENAFSNSYNITEACQYAGISRTTFYEWLADDDIFSYRMSVAQAKPLRRAKEVVTKAIDEGDPQIALRYLTLRDPDFKPKAEVTNTVEETETRQKIKEFLDDTTDGTEHDTGGEPVAADTASAGSEVAQPPTDIS